VRPSGRACPAAVAAPYAPPMNADSAALLVLAALFLAVAAGRRLRRLAPDHHVTAESRDAIKLAIGVVATMSALVLGLLLSTTKSSFDQKRGSVITLASQFEFLDRVLLAYGTEADAVRAELGRNIESFAGQLWTSGPATAGSVRPGNAAYLTMSAFRPSDPVQQDLKARALSTAADIGQQVSMLHAQSSSSISWTMLVVVVWWLFVMLLAFSFLAPDNVSTTLALTACALSIAGALFLILELDHPFSGIVRIPSEPLERVLKIVETPNP
jgi:hypothetical protein